MKDKDRTLAWIKAWAIATVVTLVSFSAVIWMYTEALVRYGILEGGAL